MAESQWLIEVDMGGWTKSYGMSGPRSAAAAKAEFERQQQLTDKDGLPYFPAGEIKSVRPRNPEKPKPEALTKLFQPAPAT